MGSEQIPGVPQSQAFQQSIWPQPAYAWQQQYGMPTPAYGQQPSAGQAGISGFAPFPTPPSGSAQPGTGQPQQPISELVAHILPLAQQMILPQVIAMAVPLIQQLIAQQAGSQQFGQPNWGQQATASFAPGTRQYAGVS
jgi:hypothetical protein